MHSYINSRLPAGKFSRSILAVFYPFLDALFSGGLSSSELVAYSNAGSRDHLVAANGGVGSCKFDRTGDSAVSGIYRKLLYERIAVVPNEGNAVFSSGSICDLEEVLSGGGICCLVVIYSFLYISDSSRYLVLKAYDSNACFVSDGFFCTGICNGVFKSDNIAFLGEVSVRSKGSALLGSLVLSDLLKLFNSCSRRSLVLVICNSLLYSLVDLSELLIGGLSDSGDGNVEIKRCGERLIVIENYLYASCKIALFAELSGSVALYRSDLVAVYAVNLVKAFGNSFLNSGNVCGTAVYFGFLDRLECICLYFFKRFLVADSEPSAVCPSGVIVGYFPLDICGFKKIGRIFAVAGNIVSSARVSGNYALDNSFKVALACRRCVFAVFLKLIKSFVNLI